MVEASWLLTTTVQPDGGVIVGLPRTLTPASMTSPETTPAGIGSCSVVVARLLPDEAARNVIPAADTVAGTIATACEARTVRTIAIRVVRLSRRAENGDGAWRAAQDK